MILHDPPNHNVIESHQSDLPFTSSFIIFSRHFRSYERSMDAENAVREIAQKPAFTVMN